MILDLLTVKFLLTYSTRPLQIFGLVGIAMALLGAIVLGWLAFVRLVDGDASFARVRAQADAVAAS